MKHFLLLCLLLLVCYNITDAQTPTFAGSPDSSHVLIVYNSQDQTSIDVKNYYQLKRGIPESNIVELTELDTLTDITHNGETHTIYLDQQGEIIRDTNNANSPEPSIHSWIYFNDRIA
ncbi:MAG: hypothetical protein M5U17_16505 [Ignavibacterium sp.]|nr:hypothetical protein [Ignavibacterium sp.]